LFICCLNFKLICAVAAPDNFCDQGIARAVIQITSAGAIYVWTNSGQGRNSDRASTRVKSFLPGHLPWCSAAPVFVVCCHDIHSGRDVCILLSSLRRQIPVQHKESVHWSLKFSADPGCLEKSDKPIPYFRILYSIYCTLIRKL